MPKPIEQIIEVQHGKPVLAGRRLPVSVIVGSLAGGMNYDEVISEYSVTMDEILSCLAYAASNLDLETIYPLSDVG